MFSAKRIPSTLSHINPNEPSYRYYKDKIDERVEAFKTENERAFARAALTGDITKVNALLDQGINVNALDKNDFTVLMHLASLTNHPYVRPVMEILLARKANPDLHSDEYNFYASVNAFSCALDSEPIEPHWDAIEVLMQHRANTKRPVRSPVVMYDFSALKPVVYQAPQSIMKEFSSHCLTSYSEIARMRALVKRQLEQEEVLNQSSHSILSDALTMLALSRPNYTYPEQIARLQKDERILKNAMWQFEQQTYVRMASSLLFIGSLFTAKSLKFPLAIIGLSSTALLAGLSTLLRPIHSNLDREETIRTHLRDDRMVFTNKCQGLLAWMKKQRFNKHDAAETDVPQPPAYR